MTDSNHTQKRNLHIIHDDKFTDGAIEQFEKYYPGQNIYVVLLNDGNKLKFTTANSLLSIYQIRSTDLKKNIQDTIRSHGVKNLFIHYLDNFKAGISDKILSLFSLKFYWVFYGGDLYSYLQQYCGYQILDEPSKISKPSLLHCLKYVLWFGSTPKQIMLKALRRVDYFCFWNEYDFELYQSHFKSHAMFKPFIYYNALGNPDVQAAEKENIILVNHSASPSGNHGHILRLLSELRFKRTGYQLLLPLSYGDQQYADKIVAESVTLFGDKVDVLRDFIPLKEYQEKLAKVKIAIFGMKRQEAAGNIFQLLNMGAKVFLREENTLLKWLRNRDFIVYSVEKDLQDIQQIAMLSDKEIAHNQERYHKYFNTDVYNDIMTNLIEE